MIKTDQSGSGAKSQDAEFKRQVECGLRHAGLVQDQTACFSMLSPRSTISKPKIHGGQKPVLDKR
jgi:hypothetical protein